MTNIEVLVLIMCMFRNPRLEPKHKIFLSHSGTQKNFTAQLCEDLIRVSHFPFFDKRPDSLPKGKEFPSLLFKAARQCWVAILVLPEEFFTRSKWPMVELNEFVQAQDRWGETDMRSVERALRDHDDMGILSLVVAIHQAIIADLRWTREDLDLTRRHFSFDPYTSRLCGSIVRYVEALHQQMKRNQKAEGREHGFHCRACDQE